MFLRPAFDTLLSVRHYSSQNSSGIAHQGRITFGLDQGGVPVNPVVATLSNFIGEKHMKTEPGSGSKSPSFLYEQM
jgi:hypothetical protein